MDSVESLEVIRAQLSAGEYLLWSGKPKPGLCFRSSDMIMIPFSLLWGGFACWYEWLMLHRDTLLFARLVGLPFVVIGVYLIVGRFAWDAYERANTSYGVSNQRIIIVTQTPGVNVKSFSLRHVTQLVLTPGGDGRGSIKFGIDIGALVNFMADTPQGSRLVGPEFEMIDDAESVHEMVRQQIEKIQTDKEPRGS